MGLLDRSKRKQAAAAAQSASAPASAPQAAASSPAAPISSADSDSLRDMLIAAVSARDNKLLATLAAANREAIAASFTQWQKVPEAVRSNDAVMQRYASTLIALAELFRDRFSDTSLAEKLSGPRPDKFTAQWEQGLAQADAMVKELRYSEAKSVLQQILAALAQVPADGPVPYHAVTHGRLGHTLFSMGEAEPAARHMLQALQLCEQRNDEQGVAAGLRGMYEISRYLGKTAEAADFGDRLCALLEKKGNATDAQWWTKQSARTRAGEPLCRVVFFVNEQQYEVDEVPRLSEGQVRYGYVRNRPPIALCEALVHRGMQLGTQAKLEEALGQFREAWRIDPHDPNSHYQAAITLMHLQRPDEALMEFDAVDERAPGWFNSRCEHWLAGEIASGRIEPPVFFILRTEEIPDTAMTWDQKLTLVDQTIARAGELPPLLLYRARCLMRTGQLAESEPVLRRALARAVEPDIRTRLLVDLQMVAQDPSEKRRLLQEAISLNGNLASGAVARVTLRQMEMGTG